jgi:glycosyltransferase involved in cell wall biosynthesis
MRIAIVAEPFVPVPPKQYGGIEQVVHYLIKGLQEAGHEPILLGPGDSEVDCELIPTTENALFFPRAKKDLPSHIKRVKQARRVTTAALKALLPRIDIIHSHGYDLTPFKGFPNVTTLHNSMKFEDLDIFMKRRRDLYYVSISQNQQTACPDLNYVGVVYNGEDPDEFPLITEPEDYVCFLGRMDRDKNPHLAIQLALNLGIKIKLAGKIDHEAEGYFEEEVAKYFNDPLVEYLGELDFNAKVELVSKAKCNLHPTNFREPFGLSVLEAAYCGTPTLAIARGSMPELIEPSRTGMLVEDFIEGRHHIEECFAMDREYVASRARRLFNYKTMARQYIEAYQKVIVSQPWPMRSGSWIRGVRNRIGAITRIFNPRRT